MKKDIAGILESGIPPDWFPPNARIDFLGKRHDLLSCMPLDDLLWTVEEIIEMHREHFADPNYWIHEYRPAQVKGNFDTNGQLACATWPNFLNQANGNYDLIGHACAILARYLYAASLGKDEGLALLIGSKAAAKVQATEKRDGILAEGRVVGAESQKEAAAKRDKEILEMNADLLKHSDTARWTLEKRAEYIRVRILKNETEKYSIGSIIGKIQGQA